MTSSKLSRRAFLGSLIAVGFLDLTACAGAQPQSCARTADNIEGPFYRANAPERSALVDDHTLLVRGRVTDRSCHPLDGALLDFWQADGAGEYDLSGLRFRGRLYTGPDGQFELRTVRPGRYLTGRTFRPAHIHVKASAGSGALLTTQLYFPDDPYNERDPFIDRSLIMHLEREDDVEIAQYDFVL